MNTMIQKKIRATTTFSQNRKLSILMDIYRAASKTLDLNESLDTALRILEDSFQIRSGAVFLFKTESQLLEIAAAVGLATDTYSPDSRDQIEIIDRIVKTGNPVVIPQVSKEPLFPQILKPALKLKDHELSFVGVPLKHEFSARGVLTITIDYHAKRNFVDTRNFLSLVASALVQPVELSLAIAHERQKLVDENAMLKQKLQEEYRFHNIIGNSHVMREVYEKVTQVARANTTVLIRGESGTGKELIAQAIHYNSLRHDKPFIRVNCAAIPENLIESEFFGHEKGAFTGAVMRKKGRFELANGGTIFLDEIGNLSPMTQVKLLRVLQEQEFERVGGIETVPVDTRIIAATNSPLEDMLSNGSFREDLFYRLNVFSIFLPPLRERKTDILLLADHFMLKYGRMHGKTIKRISTPAIDMLMRYHWPGNVRELENCIERSVLVCEDQVIHSYHLPPTLQTAESSGTVPRLSLQDTLAAYERELIQDALKTTRGNRAKAARLLDTTERIIGYKIMKYNIDVSRFK